MEKPKAYKIFDERSLETDYRTLVSLLQPGMKVLDVGCGTGAISAGIAEQVGPEGRVWAMDKNADGIRSGALTYAAVKNLQLFEGDILDWETDLRFDLIVSARALQWMDRPQEAVKHMVSFLKPQGWLSVLDYNHEELEWSPAPPQSMQTYYQRWLQWRADQGLNNRIAEDLPEYFEEAGLEEIESLNSDETYERGVANFPSKINIWTQVAKKHQVETVGLGTLEEREQCVEQYEDWTKQEAQKMVMKLTEVRGILNK